YIWAGPHHLLYTALPDWAQTLGMLFSLMLWAPSWGGMLNGLLTLRGAWHKVRTDPVLKFFVAGVTFYGMSTFEGPLLSIKSVNALGHYTDWIIGHVHSGALGWNGFMAAGMFYWLVPRLFGVQLWSKNLADWHFWIGTFGILLYVVSMWVSGVSQGLMWAAMEDGGLQYPNWVEMLEKSRYMYMTRTVGGVLFVVGWVMMIVNLWKTAKAGKPVESQVDVAILAPVAGPTTGQLVFGKPFAMTVLGLGIAVMFAAGNLYTSVIGFVLIIAFCVAVGVQLIGATKNHFSWHDVIETRPLAFSLLVVFAVLVGGVIELVPGIVLKKEIPYTADGEIAVAPYTPLELEGRDVYVSEGCYVCHSQMIRPFKEEKMRYGDPSRIEESMWDHPFQWGSKRTGPDLAREGLSGRNSSWHYGHMLNPRDISPGSNMPAYPWLAEQHIDPAATPDKLKAMKALGVPYDKQRIAGAEREYREQAGAIVAELAAVGQEIEPTTKLVALIAYLNRLGKNKLAVNVAGGK
ncbi:MAG: cytochrome-c oxidase, cbb3-type subunit II, partial [Planctomycetes bacterium]|nr:cytochrome-c oxidase, cbb3-type subunit II [Planctomycetota bacterium]